MRKLIVNFHGSLSLTKINQVVSYNSHFPPKIKINIIILFSFIGCWLGNPLAASESTCCKGRV